MTVIAADPTSAVWRRRLRIWGLFIGLTALMTWPNVLHLATQSVEHQDIFFNLWRMRWVHHALLTAPSQLFNGNQFYPEPGVLAFSDAMLLESLIALPLLSLHLPPMLVHNLLLLGAIAASGIGMFALARLLWNSDAAAVVAGIIFAFAPYRFSHYMHMELQWTLWIPWALWAMQRTLESGRLKYGLLTGTFIALQLISSIYYALFLVVLMLVIGGIQLVAARASSLAAIRAFAAGALIVLAVAWPYSAPYRAASKRVPLRSLEEIGRYSATPSSYLRVPEANRLYGRWRPGSTEVSLYPGLVPAIFGLLAIAVFRPTRTSIAYGAGMLVAFDLSLGLNGILYPLLQQHVGPFKGLRAPSRASIFFLMCLGVLAARTSAAALDRLPSARRLAATLGIVALVLVEYWSAPMRLIRYPNDAVLYRFLALQPPGVVLEFPLPRLDTLPFHDGRYLYMSTFHWFPLVNGYSGYYPDSYIKRLIRLSNFPYDRALAQLRADNVRYVVIHEDRFPDPDDGLRMVEEFVRLGARPLDRLDDGWYPATLLDVGPLISR